MVILNINTLLLAYFSNLQIKMRLPELSAHMVHYCSFEILAVLSRLDRLLTLHDTAYDIVLCGVFVDNSIWHEHAHSFLFEASVQIRCARLVSARAHLPVAQQLEWIAVNPASHIPHVDWQAKDAVQCVLHAVAGNVNDTLVDRAVIDRIASKISASCVVRQIRAHGLAVSWTHHVGAGPVDWFSFQHNLTRDSIAEPKQSVLCDSSELPATLFAKQFELFSAAAECDVDVFDLLRFLLHNVTHSTWETGQNWTFAFWDLITSYDEDVPTLFVHFSENLLKCFWHARHFLVKNWVECRSDPRQSKASSCWWVPRRVDGWCAGDDRTSRHDLVLVTCVRYDQIASLVFLWARLQMPANQRSRNRHAVNNAAVEYCALVRELSQHVNCSLLDRMSDWVAPICRNVTQRTGRL